jgi:hypothetical protein
VTNVDPAHPSGGWTFWDPNVGARKQYRCPMPPVNPRIGDTWDDNFVFRLDPEEGVWPGITEVPVTFPTNTFARSIVTPVVDANGVASTRVARTAWTAGAEVNDRRVLTFDDVPLLDDIRVKASLHNRVAAQQGIALRVNNIGGPLTQNMYSVWNDDTLGFAAWWNLGNWKGTDANFAHNEPVNGFVEGLETVFDIFCMKRTANVVAAALEAGRDYRTGESILVFDSFGLGNTSFESATAGISNFAVHAPARQRRQRDVRRVRADDERERHRRDEDARARDVVADGADATATSVGVAARGTFPGGKKVIPHWTEVWLKGTTLRARWWRGRAADTPPGWNDPRYAMVWRDTTPLGPTGTGKVGLIDAHHHLAGQLADWAWVEVTRGERGRKVFTASGWKSLESLA